MGVFTPLDSDCDAEEAGQPADDPAHDPMAIAAMMAPLEAFDFHPGHELVAEHQDHGCDDRQDDRTKQAAADGDAQEAKQPEDHTRQPQR